MVALSPCDVAWVADGGAPAFAQRSSNARKRISMGVSCEPTTIRLIVSIGPRLPRCRESAPSRSIAVSRRTSAAMRRRDVRQQAAVAGGHALLAARAGAQHRQRASSSSLTRAGSANRPR